MNLSNIKRIVSLSKIVNINFRNLNKLERAEFIDNFTAMLKELNYLTSIQFSLMKNEMANLPTDFDSQVYSVLTDIYNLPPKVEQYQGFVSLSTDFTKSTNLKEKLSKLDTQLFKYLRRLKCSVTPLNLSQQFTALYQSLHYNSTKQFSNSSLFGYFNKAQELTDIIAPDTVSISAGKLTINELIVADYCIKFQNNKYPENFISDLLATNVPYKVDLLYDSIKYNHTSINVTVKVRLMATDQEQLDSNIATLLQVCDQHRCSAVKAYYLISESLYSTLPLCILTHDYKNTIPVKSTYKINPFFNSGTTNRGSAMKEPIPVISRSDQQFDVQSLSMISKLDSLKDIFYTLHTQPLSSTIVFSADQSFNQYCQDNSLAEYVHLADFSKCGLKNILKAKQILPIIFNHLGFQALLSEQDLNIFVQSLETANNFDTFKSNIINSNSQELRRLFFFIENLNFSFLNTLNLKSRFLVFDVSQARFDANFKLLIDSISYDWKLQNTESTQLNMYFLNTSTIEHSNECQNLFKVMMSDNVGTVTFMNVEN